MTRRPPAGDPFTVLGLPRAADISDDEVRAAWRRVAAATHPDREDGGDPSRFAHAAAAYTTLRTRFGRSEALADLDAPGRPWIWLRHFQLSHFRASRIRASRIRASRIRLSHVRFSWAGSWPGARFASRVRRGRPGRLALRILAAAGASAVAVAAAGPHPAGPALVTGALTWLVVTARRDLAPPR